MNKQIKTIDEYISQFPKNIQKILQKIRKEIKDLAPNAEEVISYGIPTFKLNGRNLIHFAGYKNHIGFYPGTEAVEIFKNEVLKYKTSKGTIQFDLNDKIPYDLIIKITKFCLTKF